MRVEQSPLRGEAGRVAARVRELMDRDDPSPDDDPVRRPSWSRQLAAVIPVRVDPGRRAAWAVGAAVLVAALLTGLWVINSRPRPLAVGPAGAAPTTAQMAALPGTVPLDSPTATSAAAPAPSASASAVVVDVAGRVRRPGLYHLPAGSRIDDALTAAGGPRRGVDLSTLNLAALVVDGQQILVGVAGGPAVAGAAAPGQVPALPASASGSSIAPVSLNTGTLEQLETLPRIGPVTAQKILDYRAAHGSFTSIDQLKDVSGIGDITFAGLEPLVTL